jgi:hypothetical protein
MAKASSKQNYPYSSLRFYEKPVYHYLLIAAIVAAFIVSIFALASTYQLKKSLVPDTISTEDFLKKLTSHDEVKAYVGVSPLNIVQITDSNFANLQSQISGLDISYVGNFIVQYTDRIVVYDYANDIVRGSVGLQQPQQAQLPDDFLIKLYNHPETQGMQNEQPIGGQIDAASLATLTQQFPDVYANAKVGDFLLRYSTKLIIYDYNENRIVNAVELK